MTAPGTLANAFYLIWSPQTLSLFSRNARWSLIPFNSSFVAILSPTAPSALLSTGARRLLQSLIHIHHTCCSPQIRAASNQRLFAVINRWQLYFMWPWLLPCRSFLVGSLQTLRIEWIPVLTVHKDDRPMIVPFFLAPLRVVHIHTFFLSLLHPPPPPFLHPTPTPPPLPPPPLCGPANHFVAFDSFRSLTLHPLHERMCDNSPHLGILPFVAKRIIVAWPWLHGSMCDTDCSYSFCPLAFWLRNAHACNNETAVAHSNKQVYFFFFPALSLTLLSLLSSFSRTCHTNGCASHFIHHTPDRTHDLLFAALPAFFCSVKSM